MHPRHLQADTSACTIRKLVLSSAAVTHVAGKGDHAFADGIGSAASFFYPQDVVISNTNVFALVGNTANQLVRHISMSSLFVSTLAGTPGVSGSADGLGSSASFYCPQGITIDALGVMALVADCGNSLIRKVIISSRLVTTLAGTAGLTGFVDGAGLSSRFNSPAFVKISADGTFALIVSDGCTKHSSGILTLRPPGRPTPETILFVAST